MKLVVTGIEAAQAERVERAVEVSEVQPFDGAVRVDGAAGTGNMFVGFSDPDGNGWAAAGKPALD
jgi:hypothetical protein